MNYASDKGVCYCHVYRYQRIHQNVVPLPLNVFVAPCLKQTVMSSGKNECMSNYHQSTVISIMLLERYNVLVLIITVNTLHQPLGSQSHLHV